MFWKLLSTTWAPVAWLTLLLPGPKTSSSFQSSSIANDSAAIDEQPRVQGDLGEAANDYSQRPAGSGRPA